MVALAVWAVWSPGAAPNSPLADLAWLAGCWVGSSAGTTVEEQWMRPAGGMMLGMSRTVSGDSVRTWETMQIREEGGRLVFTARPSGQPEASFGSTEITATGVVFENAAHDFPQRVIYRRAGADSLQARIEGMRGGRPRGMDFPMRRTRCAADAGD
jgi:hypothetical protein